MKLNPQPGDIVHVRAKVYEVGTLVEFDKNHQLPMFNLNGLNFVAEKILAIEPRPLKVGDRVRWIAGKNNDSFVGMLKAIDQECVAWVRRDSGGYFTIQLSALTKEP